jgi:hypothetical protein
MKSPMRHRWALVGLLALGGAAYGQVPGTNDTSDGDYNTGSGTLALSGSGATSAGQYNTGSGYGALYNLQSGTGNTAGGALAMSLAIGGIYNTGYGFEALYGSLIGSTGSLNTGVGTATLFSYTSGSDNTALGYESMFSTTSGSDNTASGYYALYNNITGNFNVASGYQALFKNKVGGQNTAYGANALNATTAGDNTGIGYEALYKNTAGKNNVALGWEAGSALTTGSNNIEIANNGVAGESDTIRIGSATQTATYVAGIYANTTVSGRYVVIDANGQLGTTTTPSGAAMESASTQELRRDVQLQAAQIHDLQEQLSRLKARN